MTDVVARFDWAGRRPRLAGLSRFAVADRLLGAAAAAALAVDAYVHASNASYYASNGSGLITEGNIFLAETAAAAFVALLLVVRPQRISWTLSLIVAATALAAVVVSTYVDIGAIGPIPDLYEPTWQPPGKLLSAYAEGAATALSIAGLALTFAVYRRRRST